MLALVPLLVSLTMTPLVNAVAFEQQHEVSTVLAMTVQSNAYIHGAARVAHTHTQKKKERNTHTHTRVLPAPHVVLHWAMPA